MRDGIADTNLVSRAGLVPEEPRRILLVEDDDQEASRIGAALVEAWPQVQIFRARSVAESGAALNSGVECILLEMGPSGSALGFDTIHLIRGIDPELPIVVLVDAEAEERGALALGTGAQDYVVKGADGLHMARAIRHSIQRARAERFWRELAVLRFQSDDTARVQRGLIPRPMIDDPSIETRTGYRPGNRRQVLGGDFFDVVQGSPTRLHLVLGDVCGHGPDEAALGVQLRIAWRTLIMAGVGQQQALETLDRLASHERHAEHIYATLASIEIDLDSRMARVALAGHPPPIVCEGGEVRLLTDNGTGPPLGLQLPQRWDFTDVELGPDWMLLMYSDGIYEGHIPAPGARLGIDGLLSLLGEFEDPDSIWSAIPDRLLDHVEELNGGPLEDDVALLAVRRD